MTTYAPNFTPRYKLTYRHGGITHTSMVRGVRGASLATMDAVGAQLVACWDLIPAAAKYTDLLALSAETALTDSDVFVPALFPAMTPGTSAPNLASAMIRVTGLSWTGRAPGSHARFTMFGIFYGSDAPAGFGADGQILTSELAAIGSIAALATTHFKAGSGENAVFPGRATLKVNDHLLRLVRRGIIT